ncbi:deoxyribodipyrimidine photo-lyase [Methylovorus sp. MP688]|uniref:cryptochrome/photolyase family protein n=1 Tax=Methylovorus sp. (strain MP688) TaxID=887061 RepID=UPI0001EC4E66|nr:deoxyribodipyrimidine photo-lyase [Methylovorus sp. MP688]ADQ85275.1 Deoxyribodipyrimidine photo-lyase [Methylovorus sp. MP688]
MTTSSYALVWFRRDLRDFDHAALYHALKAHTHVYCAFVFDTDILDALPDRADRRVEFIWESVRELQQALRSQGGDLIMLHACAKEGIPALAVKLKASAVYSNRDYEPDAVARDAEVAAKLASHDIAFHQYKDQVIFEQDEVLTQAGKPYGVFTPYKNAHLKKLNDFYLQAYPVDRYRQHLAAADKTEMPTLESMGFARTNLGEMKLPTGMSGGQQLFAEFQERMARYKDARDFPAVKGPSYLSVHLRFGTVSIRHLARTAWQQHNAGAETWLNELIWRDFYFQVLHHHPQVAAGRAFKLEFDAIAFPNQQALFDAWCEGRTGYPLVDAAMRQLNQTGYMHNRLRMVTASFLVKDLLIDWRWGERYFAERLIDFDLAANNGGWQWAASTGCDAQPWFRIFNPVTQSEKFDAQGKFIRKYVPELAACHEKEIHAPWLMPPLRQQSLGLVIGKDYPAPVVEHSVQREKALALYKNASSTALPED